jgi:hypothetical protein
MQDARAAATYAARAARAAVAAAITLQTITSGSLGTGIAFAGEQL